MIDQRGQVGWFPCLKWIYASRESRSRCVKNIRLVRDRSRVSRKRTEIKFQAARILKSNEPGGRIKFDVSWSVRRARAAVSLDEMQLRFYSVSGSFDAVRVRREYSPRENPIKSAYFLTNTRQSHRFATYPCFPVQCARALVSRLEVLGFRFVKQ